MPDPSSPRSTPATTLRPTVRLFGLACAGAGTGIINAAEALAPRGQALWPKVAVALCFTVLALGQGRRLRAALGAAPSGHGGRDSASAALAD